MKIKNKDLNEGEVICNKCKGKGTKDKVYVCDTCDGDGKVDWVRNVVERPTSVRSSLSLINVKRALETLEATAFEYFPNIQEFITFCLIKKV